MTTSQQTSSEYFRTLNILFIALIAGQVLFATVIAVLKLIGSLSNQGAEIRQVLLFAVPIFIVGGIYASMLVFKSKLNQIKSKTDLKQKMSDYRAALMVRWALLEAPGFLSLIVCFLTGDLLFLGMTVIVIAYFVTTKPGIERTITELELDFDDKMKLNDPDAIIAEISLNK